MNVKFLLCIWLNFFIFCLLFVNPTQAQNKSDRATQFETRFNQLKNITNEYAPAPTGRLTSKGEKIHGRRHPYFMVVPDNYDNRKSYGIRVYLHGGINRESAGAMGSWWKQYEQLTGDTYISIFPAAWRRSRWWDDSQIQNINKILIEVKKSYNIDENRQYLIGVSDGGSGAYFFASRAPTPWAGFVCLIGNPGVSGNPRMRAGGEMFAVNFVNRPLLAINGENDKLYPATTVKKYLDLFAYLGAEIIYKQRPEGHTVKWWSEEQALMENFFLSHPRDPLPDSITWETETTDRYNRISWLVIEELKPNQQQSADSRDDLDPFPHSQSVGRVELQRVANRVSIKSSGVKQLTLLLSPEQFNMSEPIKVVGNGAVIFNGLLTPDIDVLNRWYERDRDRKMLFAAELTVRLPD